MHRCGEIIADIEKMPVAAGSGRGVLGVRLRRCRDRAGSLKELGGGKDLSPIYRVLFEPLAQARGMNTTYTQDLVKSLRRFVRRISIGRSRYGIRSKIPVVH